MNPVRDRSRTAARCAFLLTTAAVMSCTSPTVATDASSVEPLTDQPYTFACGAWSPSTPSLQRTLFDIRLAESDVATEPSRELLSAVTAAGGRVVYRFHGPQVRVELDVAAVPRIFTINFAKSVVDPEAHDVSLIVMLTHDLTDADVRAAEALGGRVTRRFDALDGYVVVIDDAKVPAVRALPGVNIAGFDAVGCLF